MASTAVVDVIWEACKIDEDPSVGTLIRSQLYLIASAVSGVPSENTSPSRSLSV